MENFLEKVEDLRWIILCLYICFGMGLIIGMSVTYDYFMKNKGKNNGL